MYLLFFHPLSSYKVPSMLELSSTEVSRLVRSCIAMAAWGTIMREGAQNGGRALNGGSKQRRSTISSNIWRRSTILSSIWRRITIHSIGRSTIWIPIRVYRRVWINRRLRRRRSIDGRSFGCRRGHQW